MVTGASTHDAEPFIVTALVPDDLTDTPNFVPARYAEGYAMLERAEYAGAVEALRAASAQDPLLDPEPRPAIARGAGALRAGRVAEAIEHFSAATREHPGSEPHRLLGVAYWLSADHERSIQHLERAIALRRDDERARLMLARVLEEIGDTARTEQVLADTVQAIPSSAAAHWRLARRHEAANRTEDAVREYEAAARIGALTGETPLLVHIGELYRRDFDTVRAESAFARAVALSPNHGVAHRERGRTLLQLDRPDAALVELAAALLLDRDDYESCLTIGDIHLDAGRYAEAARVLTHATAIQPDKPEAHYALATALARGGRRDEAAPHLETFARLQAAAFDDQRRRIELSTLRLEAAMLAQKGEFDRSAALWTRIVADAPDAGSHAGLAGALAGQGQLEAAAAQYEQAIALDAPATVSRQLAALYDRMGRPEAAARTRARLARTQQDALGVGGATR
jgi:tetratricopeptide (TPR) repeat protein